MYKIIRTNQFIKDAKNQKKRGKNLSKLFSVIDTLPKGKKLDSKFKPHKLVGNFKNYNECHIEPNWLLIYSISNQELLLARTGTHADLFE